MYLHKWRFKRGFKITPNSSLYVHMDGPVYVDLRIVVFRNIFSVMPLSMLALWFTGVWEDRRPTVVVTNCDLGSEVQVLELEELISKECPYANTDLPYYYKWGSAKHWAPDSGVLLAYTCQAEREEKKWHIPVRPLNRAPPTKTFSPDNIIHVLS